MRMPGEIVLRGLLAAGLLAGAQAATAAPSTRPAQPAAPPGWVLDWSDEFEGRGLDRTKWVAETGGDDHGNDEKQFYTARPGNLRVAKGMLVIEARRERMGGKAFTSARIKT